MPDTTEPWDHVKPFVYESPTSKALHFSISEIQSRMQTRQPDVLDLEYTRTMMAFLLFNSRPDNVAMIGLGGGSLAKFCHRHLPASRIQVVEINPHVIALRDEFQVPRDDHRFTVVRGDGAGFVRRPPTRFDVVLVDGFDINGLPARLSSQRFYDDCRDSLQPRGVMVANLPSGHRDHALHIERIRRSFGDSMIVVDDADMSNSVVFAGKGGMVAGRHLLVRPSHIDILAWRQLAPSFERVASALSSRQELSASQPREPRCTG